MKPQPCESSPSDSLTVLFDGACPLCRREIALYRGQAEGQAVCFADVSDPAQVLPAGHTQAELLARFHVQLPDGRLLSGAEAFLALWARLPGWRCLAWLGRLPGVARSMEWAYLGFLRVRPAVQRGFRRWKPD